MSKKIGLLLVGCGVFDGTEIREATLAIMALETANVEIVYLSLNKTQHHVINHNTQSEAKEMRNMLVESARIARGPVYDLEEYDISQLDGLVVPGGFGVAKNACNFATSDKHYQLDKTVEKTLKALSEDKKPLGFACIAPVLAAKVFPGAQLTIGSDPETIKALEKEGALHKLCAANEIALCKQYKVVTTPAYMLDAPLSEIYKGFDAMIQEVIRLTD